MVLFCLSIGNRKNRAWRDHIPQTLPAAFFRPQNAMQLSATKKGEKRRKKERKRERKRKRRKREKKNSCRPQTACEGKKIKEGCWTYWYASVLRSQPSLMHRLRKRMKKWIESPPKFEMLVLGCIDADVCKQILCGKGTWKALD